MPVQHIPCGPYVNQSERDATESLVAHLKGANLPGTWLVLSNCRFSSRRNSPPDELDILLIAPNGVHVIEVKHWDSQFLKHNDEIARHEAEKLNEKAKRVAGKARGLGPDPGYVPGKLLLTRNPKEKFAASPRRQNTQGVELYGLGEWRELAEIDSGGRLSDADVHRLRGILMPDTDVVCGDLKSFAEFVDLEPLGPQDAFRRVFRAWRRQGSNRNRVILHLYDLSASSDRNAKDVACREFDVLQRLQKNAFLPTLMDSFQDASSYPGELCFFSYVDPAAPSLEQRAKDDQWSIAARIQTAALCAEALEELHSACDENGAPMNLVHRYLSPASIRIRSTGKPLFTQCQFARLPGLETVDGRVEFPVDSIGAFLAPEVRKSGLGCSTPHSDTYALCVSLRSLFEDRAEADPLADRAMQVLSAGMCDEVEERLRLDDLAADLRGLLEAPPSCETAETAPVTEESVSIAPEYWDEDTCKELNGRHYRIRDTLGKGGVGITFRVTEVDANGEELDGGGYAAKVFTNEKIGKAAADAYARVRAQTGGAHLAVVFEVGTEWKPDGITALLKWLPGDTLFECSQYPLQQYLADCAEGTTERAALRWLRDLCTGLTHLHQAGIVHGDVSARNIIVNGANVTLTDFDLATLAGSIPLAQGTEMYCAPEAEAGKPVHPSNDLFALAATFFHALFDRDPFAFGESRCKARGLNWDGVARDEWPLLASFLDHATDPDPERRFRDAMSARQYLEARLADEPAPSIAETSAVVTLKKNEVPWLDSLVQSYRGTGGVETRGMDSDFARDTYVETRLDDLLTEDIVAGQVSLVVLCGNVGDGKTAFLQNLARRLGLPPAPSSQRLWDCTLASGQTIRANLDGSASYQGRSATDLLDEIFAPFHSEDFPQDVVHLVAINDGPLLSWLEGKEQSYLTEQLEGALRQDSSITLDPRIRFIHFNARSLVGGHRAGDGVLTREFLDSLIDKLLGQGCDPWQGCLTCTAQARCSAWQSVRDLRHAERGPLLRRRLARALLAVHLRGEMHITARELRGALVYILFGTHRCRQLHEDQRLQPRPYWDRAFDAELPDRRSDLLDELARLDPALESHPRVDAMLIRDEDAAALAAGCAPAPLPSLRRRAYFQWSDEHITCVGGEGALDLARCRHLDAFLRVGVGNDDDRKEICSSLCRGIARLEDLPEIAFGDVEQVPLRITPRTPTETAFWVSKPRERFSVQALLPPAANGLDVLHTHICFRYHSKDGRTEDLIIGAELFHLLMELKDGYQLSYAGSDDVFANLSVFTQRLAQEDDQVLYAWSPLDERIYKMQIEMSADRQQLCIAPVESEVR